MLNTEGHLLVVGMRFFMSIEVVTVSIQHALFCGFVFA